MKAQTLGLVLGMNMAVACLMMQGCKAVKPAKDLPPPEVVDQPVQQPAQQPVVTEIETAPTPAPSVSGASVQQEMTPPPSTTPTVGKLPPPPKPVVSRKSPASGAAESTSAPETAPAAATVHTVQRGEYLSSISKKYNVKMSAIVAANPGLNPNRIRIGQKINIPGSSAAPKSNVMLASAPAAGVTPAAGVAPAAANTAAPVKMKPAFKSYTGPTKEYVVKGGDSLGKIALANGISIRALKELNGLTKDTVRVGQKLKVPSEKVVAEKLDAVKKADGVPTDDAEKKVAAPIAAPEKKDTTATAPVEEKKTDAPATEVEPAVPAAETSATDTPSSVVAEAASVPETSGNTYTVKEGDDIVSISIAWGISPSQLMNANDLKDNEQLKPGTILKLPPNARQTVQ